ncbi:MAG: hypothetical protein L3K14_04660 [Thermoplasmata archaeon]|nr:hypothetical protein [Thermoplasmata archaeon]
MIPRLASDFDPALIDSSRSALIELVRTLSPYPRAIILVGGWVPWLLIRDHLREGETFTHVGSIDIDFVVDPAAVRETESPTMAELMVAVGWRRMPVKHFGFERTIIGSDSIPRDIQVDFLTTAPDGEVDQYLHRELQPGFRAKTMAGAEIALRHHAPHLISGTGPDGVEVDVEVEMLDAVGCLGTKGIALGARFKHKDAYDIVSVLDNYGAGVEEVSDLVRPFAEEPRLAEALRVIREKFATERSDGPVWYADFLGPGDEAARLRLEQRAFQLASEFLRLLG